MNALWVYSRISPAAQQFITQNNSKDVSKVTAVNQV